MCPYLTLSVSYGSEARVWTCCTWITISKVIAFSFYFTYNFPRIFRNYKDRVCVHFKMKYLNRSGTIDIYKQTKLINSDVRFYQREYYIQYQLLVYYCFYIRTYSSWGVQMQTRSPSIAHSQLTIYYTGLPTKDATLTTTVELLSTLIILY